jgi:thioredoxin-related protein
MKKILLLALFAVTLFGSEIHWIKDFKTAVQIAKKEHKPIIFVATKDGCKYCKMLKTTTLKDKEVIKKINADYVPLQLNLYRNDALVPYMIAVYTRGFPTIWFLNEDGKALFEPIGGYIESKEMKNALKIVKEAYNKQKVQKGQK